MSEQRYSYATVGKNDERNVPVVVTGKRNATFKIGSEEFDRTAILRLPERMTPSEFNQWKSEAGIDLLDIFFHCVHQKPIHPEPEEDAGEDDSDADRPSEEAEAVTDGGQQRLVTDGGSSMPKLALESLKELKETDEKIGEWLTEVIEGEEEFEAFSDLYGTEHTQPGAANDIHLGGEGGYSLKRAEYAELINILEQARVGAADNPTVLGVRNRLLMQLILGNPGAYASVKEEMAERAAEMEEEAKRLRNQQRSRQQMTERHQQLNGDVVDTPLDDDEEEENDGGA